MKWLIASEIKRPLESFPRPYYDLGSALFGLIARSAKT